MDFSQAISSGFKSSFRMKGRATRSEYWYFFLLFFMLSMAARLDQVVEKASFAYSMGYIHHLQSLLDLHQLANPAAAMPELIGLLIFFVMITLFSLGTAIVLLMTAVPLVALQVRRLHDTGRSGWWVIHSNLALLVGAGILATGSVAGVIIAIGFFTVPLVLVYFLAQPGDVGENKYDFDPSDAPAPRKARRERVAPNFPSPPSAVMPAE